MSVQPGGAAVIVKHGGQDVTFVLCCGIGVQTADASDSRELFKPIHPPRTLQLHKGTAKLIGEVDPATVTKKAPEDASEVARIAVRCRVDLRGCSITDLKLGCERRTSSGRTGSGPSGD